jgi:hypothetical protein
MGREDEQFMSAQLAALTKPTRRYPMLCNNTSISEKSKLRSLLLASVCGFAQPVKKKHSLRSSGPKADEVPNVTATSFNLPWCPLAYRQLHDSSSRFMTSGRGVRRRRSDGDLCKGKGSCNVAPEKLSSITIALVTLERSRFECNQR